MPKFNRLRRALHLGPSFRRGGGAAHDSDQPTLSINDLPEDVPIGNLLQSLMDHRWNIPGMSGGSNTSKVAHAASEGTTSAIDQLIRSSQDLDKLDENQDTLLYAAVRLSLERVVERILSARADVNRPHPLHDWTPLHEAAQIGNSDIVRLLLAHGASVHLKDDKGWTPLHVASLHGHRDIASQLLMAGADPEAKDNEGWAIMHVAADFGHRDIIQLLLEWGANINETDHEGTTPLHVVSQDRPFPILVTFLLQLGADPNLQESQGHTSLHKVLHLTDDDKMEEAVSALLAAGADVNIKDKEGASALHHALNNEKGCATEKALQLILSRVNDINAPITCDPSADTPLILATKRNFDMGVQMLIKKDANVNAPNKDGMAPLHIAIVQRQRNIIKSLLEGGADANAPATGKPNPEHYADPTNRATPLHLAARFCSNFEVISWLLEHGADPVAKDEDLSTPLDILEKTLQERKKSGGTDIQEQLDGAKAMALLMEATAEADPMIEELYPGPRASGWILERLNQLPKLDDIPGGLSANERKKIDFVTAFHKLGHHSTRVDFSKMYGPKVMKCIDEI